MFTLQQRDERETQVKTAEIVIIGSGSLARRVANALAQVTAGALRVVLIARSMAKAVQIAMIASARAAIVGKKTTFQAIEIAEFKDVDFSRAFRSLKPKVIFHTASMQSPWEGAEGQNAWTKLTSAAGFGVTLPLQMLLAAEVSRGAVDGEGAVINACYPDCVNPILQRLGYRITCGIGNVAIVEAFCRAHGEAGGNDVRVVGHHGQLSGWLKGVRSQNLPRVWVKEKEVESVRLSPKLDSIEEDLNDVTSSTAIPVILGLLTGQTLRACIPGVAGMPGGYPFEVKRGRFKLRLPGNITPKEAIEHNRNGERSDGLDLRADVSFVGQARELLAETGFEYATGFALVDWEKAAARMIALRERLRSQRA